MQEAARMEAVNTHKDNDWKTIRPFGPSIVKGKMSEELQKVLCDIFTNWSEKQEIPPEEDNSWNLAGNNRREFFINQEMLGTNVNVFQECINKGASEYYVGSCHIAYESQKEILTPKHKKLLIEHLTGMNLTVEIHGVWGNISVAGDFNPIHHHTGSVSGVGYLKLPDNIEREWLLEDHDPSSGMIHFWDGRPAPGSNDMYRVKPVVGDIYFFPAWLPHSVHPFRSKGERWSFSFNLTVDNTNADLTLTDLEKAELREERRRLMKEFNDGK